MTYLRWLRFLDRISHILRRLPFKDRWGFNLGEDLCDWAGMKEFEQFLRIEAFHRERFTPVTVTGGPRPRCTPDHHLGTTYMLTWPEGRGTCNVCGTVTYTTGSAA